MDTILSQPITLSFEDFSVDFLPAEIDFSYDTSSALEQAYSIGRTGNIFSNNLNILGGLHEINR